MVLTSTRHFRCTPWRNRNIPTIPAGRSDGGVVNVSAVDTGPRGSCGTVRRPPQVGTPLALSVALTRGREIRGPTSALALAFSEPPLLHEGRDLLAKGWAHCTKALPARSTPDPPPVVPDPRGAPPSQASTAHSKEDHAPNHTAPIDAREHSINSQHPNTLQRATAWETSLHDRRSQDAFIDLELRAQEPTTSLRPSNRCQSRIIP